MRFRFCGGQDVPDWLLAEIVVLTKLTSVKLKLLVSGVIKDLCGSPLDYAKVAKWTGEKMAPEDVKACLSCVVFILTSAAKNDVDGETLSRELQQLGLPKESAASACKAYSKECAKLQTVLRNRSLRLWKLDQLDWTCNFVLSSSALEDVQQPSVQLKLQVTDPGQSEPSTHRCEIGMDKFQLMLTSLKEGAAMMDAVVS